jgi:GNAT superfamily N-acetyltransferase
LAIEVVPAALDHAHAIRLRPGDAREVAAMGLTPLAAFEHSMSRSLWAEAYVIDGEVAAIVGLAVDSILAGIGAPWLLTGRPVDRHPKLFLQQTRRGLARMSAEFPVLVNQVHAEYTGAIRWLRWLGFEIGPAKPYGPKGEPFCRAVWRKGLHIGPTSIAEIEAAPNLGALSQEFATESLAPGLPRTAPNWAGYRGLEAAGMLHPIAARLDGVLIGFIGVLLAPLPRHSVPVATTERFFVARAHRKTGAGLKLLRAAEAKARALGSPGLQVTAPFEGDLFQVLPRVGYRETNRVFFKPLEAA